MDITKMSSCHPSETPSLQDSELARLRERYHTERDKRIVPAGQDQYERPADEVAHAYEHDPFMPMAQREPLSEELDVAVLGGGWTGVLAGYHLKQQGVSTFRHIDHAGDFGGVWYWNRYPGVQCDNDAYCYLPLLEEMGFMPSKKFSDGFEIQAYMRSVAERFGLYDNALFHTLVTGLRWDEAINRWRISTNRGDDIRARFVIMANGLMNMPKLPGIPGLHSFKGKLFHTSRWDYDYTGGSWDNPQLDRLADKRVAIVGTGATAIQAIPHLARHAKQVYVLQRTPSNVDKRVNPPTDPEWAKSLKPGWQKERQANFHRLAQEVFQPGQPDLVCDIWTEMSRNLMAELEAEGWPELSPEEFAARQERVDFEVMEARRRWIDTIIEDRETAEALKPWFRFHCKRPLSNNEFYPVFNQPHVKLIDVSATQGVEAMTEKGFMAGGVEYEVDCMIVASGFEVTSDLERRWGIPEVAGRAGVSLYDHWQDGPSTFHGVITDRFPNLFYTGFVQTATNSSTTEQFRGQVEHIAYIIAQGLARGAEAVEPTEGAVATYVAHMREMEFDLAQFMWDCTPGYYNNEGEDRPRWALIRGYRPGWDAFMAMLAKWRADGRLEGFKLAGRPPH
jgi:cyclohexanone monooxygenase